MAHSLAIIGAGNMAEPIVQGMLNAGVMAAAQIIAADLSEDRRKLFAERFGVLTTDSAASAAADAQAILLCVKPQHAAAVLADIGSSLNPDALVVSIMAGLGSAFIGRALGDRAAWRIVRSMPNTPMLVGKGMVAIAAGAHATPADLATARKWFSAAAEVIEVTEDKIDAVTAVSGSGPAYFFFLVEQMIRAGIELGLSPDQAHTLAVQTAVGSAEMLRTATDSPQELRRKVTSPGGTTAAAIASMQSANFEQIVIDALAAAEHRSKELAQ